MSNVNQIPANIVIFQNYKNEVRKINDLLLKKEEISQTEQTNFKTRLKKAHKSIMRALAAARLLQYHIKKAKEELRQLDAAKEKCYSDLKRYQEAKMKQIGEAHFTPEDERKVEQALRRKQEYLVVKQKEVNKLEKKILDSKQELIIQQEELEVRIQDTNLAKSSYYHLTDAEFQLFTEDREKILKGVEKYGSVSLAVKKDGTIKSRVSSIMHHAKKHKQFGEDLELAKQVFKDSLDAELLDRALNGTVNPVFQKGEYIGDYAVKDNKLLVEVAKAKLPEEYNPRVYAAANPKGAGGTTINILSFDGVDETKHGYAKNIGVVKSVDDSGRVERITQSKKMLDFYKSKGTAEIIKADYERVEESNNNG